MKAHWFSLDREKSSGQTHLLRAMDRTLGQPQVKPTLLRSIPLKHRVFDGPSFWGMVHFKTKIYSEKTTRFSYTHEHSVTHPPQRAPHALQLPYVLIHTLS